jgi:hypothetical protein
MGREKLAIFSRAKVPLRSPLLLPLPLAFIVLLLPHLLAFIVLLLPHLLAFIVLLLSILLPILQPLIVSLPAHAYLLLLGRLISLRAFRWRLSTFCPRRERSTRDRLRTGAMPTSENTSSRTLGE